MLAWEPDSALDFSASTPHKVYDGRGVRPPKPTIPMIYPPLCATARNARGVNRIPAALCAIVLALGGGWPTASAVEALPPIADAVSLETAADKLAQLDEEYAKKLAETRAVVTAEAEAKRITDSVAQSLGWSLRASAGALLDVRSLISTARIPADNAALTAAFKDVEIAGTLLQTRRAALNSDLAKEVRRQVREAAHGTPAPEEILALLERIGSAQQGIERKAPAAAEPRIPWRQAAATLRVLKRLTEAENGHDLSALTSAAGAWREAASDTREVLGPEEAQARLDRLVQPNVRLMDERQAALDAALTARKPAAELTAAFTAFAEAAEKHLALRENDRGEQVEARVLLHLYRALVGIWRAVEAGDAAQSLDQIREAGNHIRNLGAARAAKYEAMLTKLDAEVSARAAKVHQQRVADLRTRLAAVRQPVDLDAIAADLRAWSAQLNNGGGPQRVDFEQVMRQLSILGAAWSSASPGLLAQQDRSGDEGAVGSAFAKELAALRSRAERDILASVLKVPELNAAPLANLPPDAALEAFCDGLAKAGEWSRLLQVLQSRPPAPGQPYGRAEDETVGALRSFLTAQNLELAEQWRDAADAYKAVLRSTGVRIPVKPAAERLKALSKEHPEINTPPVRPAEAGPVQPGLLRHILPAPAQP